MPRRNVIRVNIVNSYYHVYARGVSKQPIFIDEADRKFFLSLFSRYLSPTNYNIDKNGEYQKLNDVVELLAYCMMGNHFHLLIYQSEEDGMSRLMHGVMTSYSRYFNSKYKRTGPLLESRYRASIIDSDTYLLHISRYIHLNPENWIDCQNSSIRAYLYDDRPDWLNKAKISELYGSATEYLRFLRDGDIRDSRTGILLEPEI